MLTSTLLTACLLSVRGLNLGRGARWRWCLWGGVLALVVGGHGLAAAEENRALSAALATITVEDLKKHVDVLANDTFEGREAGSRGGHAAATYLGREFQRHQLAGGAAGNGYYQGFGNQYRNILAVMEGSDPELKKEYILISAHYDHVGYGNSTNSFGPTGFIHNGADDNASGVAGLLELIEAFAQLETRPKRSILFAFWDGEEKGLLGSKHWVEHPTIPLRQVPVMLNMDMIGRLQKDRLEVYGTRTARGLRRLVSEQNSAVQMLMDFTWEMKENSDHHSFATHNVPVLFLHTGLHSDYHRPSDDVEKLNIDGMRQVVTLLFGLANELANRDEALPGFRAVAHRESPQTQKQVERALPPLPGRLGLTWEVGEPNMPGIRVKRVEPAAAAYKAGIRAGDRVLKFGDTELNTEVDLAALVLSSPSQTTMLVQGAKAERPAGVLVELPGEPIRLGIAWRLDECDTDVAVVARVVPSSPAAKGGLQVHDRIYAVGGKRFTTNEELQDLVAAASEELELQVERSGRLSTVRFKLATSGK